MGRRLIYLALALTACRAHAPVVGLVDVENGRAQVRPDEGRPVTLVLTETSAPLRYLDDCTVSVEGNRLGGRLWVRDWQVVAAMDGSAPYVGRLRKHGSNLVLDDRYSGSTFVLEEASARDLVPFVEQPVMVIGFVVAPHVVRVMGYRVLAEP